MEQLDVKQRESSIVLVGEFDPLVMTPHWFAKQGMIPQEDIDENLAIELVYKDLTKFSLANIQVEIQCTTLILRSDHPSFDYRIHDLALSILSALKDNKVRAVGLNQYADVHFDSLDSWHSVGNLITPKDVWFSAMPDSERIGMANVQMQIMKPKGEQGLYNVTVGWLETPKAIRFSINNHYDSKQSYSSVKQKAGRSGAFDPIAIITACWQQTLDFHEHLILSLLSQAKLEIK